MTIVRDPADIGDTRPSTAELFALIGGERPDAPPLPREAAHDAHSASNEVLALLESFASTSDKVLDTDAAVSANAADVSTSDNPVFHRKRRRSLEGVLWPTAMRSTRARTAGRCQRKVLRFPALRRVYARERRDLNGFSVRSAKSYARDIWTYLETWSYRTLNDLDGAGLPLPCAEDLAELFYHRIMARGVTFFPLYSNRGHGISTVDAEKMAHDAARAVLRDWDPEWIRRQRERAARGGRASKRPPTWNDEDLDTLAQLTGQTVAQQAIILGRSPSTVDRMRRALRARPAGEG